MIGRSIIPVVIDSDNALGPAGRGSSGGDVDDAFALSFILNSKIPIQEIWSVGGNTSAARAHFNNLSLTQLIKKEITCKKGLNAGENSCDSIFPEGKNSFLALGPLTNLSFFLKNNYKPSNIWMTLGRISTNGFFPPFWPMEFNATKDLPAFTHVLSCESPITIAPLDVAFRLKINSEKFRKLQETKVGRYLSENSQRWRWRSLIMKGRRSFPVWDLLSAMACVHAEVCEIKEGKGYLFKNGLFLCDIANQPATGHNRKKAILSRDINIVTGFDPEKLWSVFFNTIQD